MLNNEVILLRTRNHDLTTAFQKLKDENTELKKLVQSLSSKIEELEVALKQEKKETAEIQKIQIQILHHWSKTDDVNLMLLDFYLIPDV